MHFLPASLCCCSLLKSVFYLASEAFEPVFRDSAMQRETDAEEVLDEGVDLVVDPSDEGEGEGGTERGRERGRSVRKRSESLST
jgi:hypothetical protein